MKHLNEYRDPARARQLLNEIRDHATRRWRIMDVCGGQTHNLLRYGIEQELEETIEFIHGPGCPVCVTPAEVIDQAIELSLRPGILLATYGDMLRVPGTACSLAEARAQGGTTRTFYTPLDAVKHAAEHSDLHVVFLAVGFETTAPATALAVKQADRLGLTNFSVLACHVLVLPAMRQVALDAGHRIDAFLAAGHVCTVTGYKNYHALACQAQLPIVVAGFEPIDLLFGLQTTVRMLEQGEIGVRNEYPRAVRSEGNREASQLLDEVFDTADQAWRGLGLLPDSGLKLRSHFAQFDAEKRFAPASSPAQEETLCRSGEVLQGRLKPSECPEFGTRCHPGHPLGAPMVSSEGACAAYFSYNRPLSENVDSGK